MTKYSTASYGRLFLSMWDKNASLLSLTEAEVIAKYTGGLPEWVLHREEATLFRPAHFLAVDHDLRCAVLRLVFHLVERLFVANVLSNGMCSGWSSLRFAGLWA